MIATESVAEILRKVPVWAGLSESSLQSLAEEFEVVEIGAGETLFREGDPGDSMYVIAGGLVRLHCGDRDLRKLRAPEFFGEMALFESAPRVASVTAVETTTLLRLDKEAFLDLLHNRIEVAIGMLHEFGRRLNAYIGTVGSLRDFVERDLLPLGVALSSEKSLDRLLTRILDEARKHTGADSGAIYLLADGQMKVDFTFCDSLGIPVGPASADARRVPPVGLLGEDGEPNLANVVAAVAHQGKSVNLPDIATAAEFDFSEWRALDEKTGYRTKSCLTVPLEDNDDRVIGVVQLLNARDPDTGAVVPFGASEQLVIDSLASLAAVALNTNRLLERQKEFLKVEHDLEVGRMIQLDFLPDTLPQPPGWEIAASFRPARQVGGDFYDVFPTEGGLIAFGLADVCDKGVGAALFMALSRSLIRAFVWQEGLAGENGEGGGAAPPREASAEAALHPVELANRYLTSFHLKMNMFVTLFFGVFEPSTGRLCYVNAGHNAPLLLASDGRLKARLTTTSPALGMFPGARFKAVETVIEPGDLLYAFTDGVTEARSPSRAFYTDERLVRLLEHPRQSASALLEQVDADVRLYVAGAEQSDDVTMLAIRRVP